MCFTIYITLPMFNDYYFHSILLKKFITKTYRITYYRNMLNDFFTSRQNKITFCMDQVSNKDREKIIYFNIS